MKQDPRVVGIWVLLCVATGCEIPDVHRKPCGHDQCKPSALGGAGGHRSQSSLAPTSHGGEAGSILSTGTGGAALTPLLTQAGTPSAGAGGATAANPLVTQASSAFPNTGGVAAVSLAAQVTAVPTGAGGVTTTPLVAQAGTPSMATHQFSAGGATNATSTQTSSGGTSGSAATSFTLGGTLGAGQAGASACPALRDTVIEPNAVDADLKSHLIAYYPFSGSLADATPSPNAGTYFSGSSDLQIHWVTDRMNRTKSAIYFDGLSYVDIPHVERFNGMASFTLSAWVKTENAMGAVISKVKENRDFVLGFGSEPAGTLLAHFSPGHDEYYTVSAPVAITNTWTFVAAVWTGCRWGLFVDGVVVGERLVPNGVTPTWIGTLLRIGRSLSDRDTYKGAIDEVRIHNRELSSDELLWLMNH